MDQKPGTGGNTKRIAKLIAHSIYDDLSQAEKTRLDKWLSENDENLRVFTEATDRKRLQQGLHFMEQVNIEEKLREVKLKGNLHFNPEIPAQKPNRLIWINRWVAGAAAVLLLAVSLTIVPTKDKGSSSGDALPGGKKAVLTLDDGSEITVHEAANGVLAYEGNGAIEKANNKLVYRRSAIDPGTNMMYNIVTTPVTGTYPITLSDGTNIWLNASSSIKFPTVFTGNERTVTVLTGEMYFEVAKDPAWPFRVELAGRDVNIEVVGTHFNVNAYPDQDSTKITLLEGEIKVHRKNNDPTTLKPEQEARVPGSGETKLIKNTDTQTAIAWKNELFRFDNNDMRNIMKEISRWYDRDIVYEGDMPTQTFKGSISRANKLSAVLRVLELNGVYSKIEGRKIIVSKMKN